MNQNDLKRKTALAALDYVTDGEVLGVGTGSTVDFFIDALKEAGKKPSACVSSSERSRKKLEALGFKVIDLNTLEDRISVYVDGADEINADFEMIVAAASDTFVCIADASKKVDVLGRFPLPVEVIPMAARLLTRELAALGGRPVLRDFVTDNGCRILDVHGLSITDAKALEDKINSMAGVVTVGLFARRGADVLLLGTEEGVKTFKAR